MTGVVVPTAAAVALALWFLWPGVPSFEPAAAAVRPNVVMISIDTLRADHLSGYGYARETSPQIDALASRGVLFEHAYSHSPKTAPSHMSILTGLTPEAHGVRQWNAAGRRLSENISTLPAMLQAAGYYTAALTAGGQMRADLGFDDGMTYFQEVPGVHRLFRRARRVIEERIGAEATADPLSPFFVFLHTYEVHAPYAPIAPYDRSFASADYDGGIISSQAELLEAADGNWIKQHQLFWSRVDRRSPADLQHLMDLYDGSIRLTDEHIGSFLTWLAEKQLLDRTLVIVLSDHGEEFLDHGRFEHDQVFEELLHVPLVMVFPGPQGDAWRGMRKSEVVRLVDVTPTVLDFLGLAAPDPLEGVSLLPMLSGGPPPPEIVVSSWPTDGVHTLREEGWKLMERISPSASWTRLFDLSTDPAETRDLANREPEVRARMQKRLRALEADSRAIREAYSPGRVLGPDAEALRSLEALGYIE